MQHENSCYELLHNRVSWSHAESLCQQGGGHLVHINSASEQQYIEAFMSRYSPDHSIWIDLHDRRTEGQFEWTAGPLCLKKTFCTLDVVQWNFWNQIPGYFNSNIYNISFVGDPVTFTNWAPGYTDNFVSHDQEDCVALIPYKGGVWDDIPCGDPGSFLWGR